MFLPLPRATLLLATPKSGKDDLKHLFIILTNANQDDDVLIVNISSLSNRCDDTCILNSSDHSFIKHKSYIAYKHSNIIKVDKLESLVIKQYEPINIEIFNKICSGLLKSKHTSPKIKKFYMDCVK
ncbi:hypothetical protein OAQ81_01815 [Candidatus Thioglobus sp.]|jgi:hypothetical protein|nr:hypothetical protein [Candidatus Thioglobus sp.]